MINENLIDPKDLEILKLKFTIKQFKKYDAERKEYYSKSIQELGKLKAYIDELETIKDEKAQLLDYKKQVESLQAKIEELKKKIMYQELLDEKSEDLNLSTIDKDIKIKNLKTANEQLLKSNKRLNRLNNELLVKMNNNQNITLHA